MASSLQMDEHISTILWQILRLLLVAGLLLLSYRIILRLTFTYRIRQRYLDLPQVTRHRLWGNLVNVGERLAPSINQHPDYVFEELWNELGQPPVFMVDLAPIDRAMLIIADPRVAEAITQPSPEYKYSTPKSNTLQALNGLIGDQSLVLIEGEDWRTQRRRFNKAFAPAHLNTLVPLVIMKTRVFLDRLKVHAQAEKPFELKHVAQDLTTDVITQLAIERDFQAQTMPEGQGPKSRFGILTAIKTMSSLTEKIGQGFEITSYFSLKRRIKQFVFDRIYTRVLHDEIISKLPAYHKAGSQSEEKAGAGSSAKAFVHLALSGLEPTPAVLNSTVSQVKTFLFAGQDTTSTTIQWMAYELSKSYPSSPLYSEHYKQIRERLCTEHDAVFGSSNPFAPLDVLTQANVNVEEILGSRLPYTTAFIKETLRLHPPGASARLIPLAPYDPNYPNDKNPQPHFLDIPAWIHSKTGEQHEAINARIDGMRLYACHFLIQRNRNIWGEDAHTFDPARFLDRSGTKAVDELEEAMNTSDNTRNPTVSKPSKDSDLPHPHHISTLPTGSYRPFERGPRTCIGSNLAYMEAKIVLTIIARGFEWHKIGLDGTKPKPREVVYGGSGKEDVRLGEARGWEVWSINNVTAVPVDGMRMEIKLR